MLSKPILAVCLGTFLLVGCASAPVELKPPHPYGEKLGKQSYSWHQLRFKWHWPADRRPDWSLDALLADQVLSGVITRYRDTLPLWRFHRRAARTPAGHQFSFIFYSSKRTAGKIKSAASDHQVTRRLLARGLLEKVRLTRPDQASALYATSDAGWPQPLQESWPMFIMGVSQTWLALIEFHAREQGVDAGDEDMGSQIERYANVSQAVNTLWSQNAQHAFFHHLSAIFGYQPVNIRKRVRF